MQAIMESLFDAAYLLFAFFTGGRLLGRSGGQGRLWGWMVLLLGAGDAFHLIPRVMKYWLPGEYAAALGIGTLATSITMTVFYLLLEYARRQRYRVSGQKGVLCILWALTLARILLCLMPQNQWTAPNAPAIWGIYRNIPLVAMGAMTVGLWFASARRDGPFHLMWLAVLLSFIFYLPVVLWADVLPIIGMLMLPKTCMYIWMLVMFTRGVKEPARLAS
ncbi:MAG: hypothetical protein IJ461_04185 [Clostridia bacterium]|nr:hypothetical protein [Clostridia bacterium]